ncbi:sodium:calcium antiporter [Candidatus Bathyarchaeota archaeon]|nr:sodium:calcium antiporter [Candidatus Bathyarchaeota archaeon]
MIKPFLGAHTLGVKLVFEAIAGIGFLIMGLALIILSSDKAVVHSVKIASALRVSPLMIGLVLVSIGTDLPEIANDVISSALGHGDITIGDSLGSVLTQITLVLGLLPFLGGMFKVKRREVAVIGTCEILALILVVSIARTGHISSISALFLVASWPIFMMITRKVTAKNAPEKKRVVPRTDRRPSYHFVVASLGFIGVAIGAYVVIQSVITLSATFHVPEYFISFFAVAIGTSLPELIVDLTAIRKKQYELAIGDAIGSCIVDATLSCGIGPLFFPIDVTGELAMITGLYALFGSIVVISTLTLREKLDKKAGTLFIVLYLLSYSMLRVT